MPRSFYHARAFTLPEALLAGMILAVAVAAISQAVVSGQMHTYQALRENRAIALTEALMDEILALPYEDPDQANGDTGPELGESNRAGLDNADDFHGFVEDFGNIRNAAGTLYPAPFQAFRRTVTAVYETIGVTGLGAGVDGLTVTVTVQDDKGATFSINRFLPEPLD